MPGSGIIFVFVILASLCVTSAIDHVYSKDVLLALKPSLNATPPPSLDSDIPANIMESLFPCLSKAKKRKSGRLKMRFIFQNVRGKDSFLSKCPDQNVLSKACVTFLSETMKLDRDSRNTFPGKKFFVASSSRS